MLRDKAFLERLMLAVVLPAVAGAVNAAGFFAVGSYTSHVTGNVARIGDELASGNLWLATRSAIFVASFLSGALGSTLLILHGKRIGGPPYWRPLLAECALIFVFATVNVGAGHRAHLNSLEMTSLICVAMGAQNALVTKLSGAVVRNTHMTGITTDIGIEIGRFFFRSFHREPQDLRKLELLAGILISFLVGATGGSMLYVWFGHFGMLLPCGVLLGLAAFDGWVGLTAHTLQASVD